MSRQTRARELAAERKEREASKSSLPKPTPFKRDGGSRARGRTRSSAAPAAAVESGSVVNAFGTSYDMGDPAQKAAYEREQSAELDRQRSKSPMADIRGGDGVKGYEDGELTRFTDPRTETSETSAPRTPLDRSNGTQTSPSGNGINQSGLNEFADLLGSKYNIRLQNGFQSNDLPGVSGVGPVADGATYARGVEATRGTTGIGPYADGDVYGQSIAPTNPQAGSSPIPDQAEIKSSVPVGVDDRFADGAEYGDTPTSAISNRSRSFLDYDGPGGSLMALRAAEASQGYIRQGGKNYAMTGAGEDGKRTFEEFSDKGRQALVKDGNSTINHSFMDQYGSKADPAAPPTADQAQSPEVGITTKVDLEPQSKIHESPADFGVGDGSFDQIMDVENNSEKLTMEPIDWMSRYRGQK